MERLVPRLLALASLASALLVAGGCASQPRVVAPPPAAALGDLHYKCYSIRDAPPSDIGQVSIDNQFNSGPVTPVRPLSLCLPVKKNGRGTFDATDLKCYSILGPEARATVRLVSDQFPEEKLEVGAAIALCTPANTAEEPRLPPDTIVREPHYVCYNVSGGQPPGHPPVDLDTRTFPPERQVAVGMPRALCLPTLKNFAGGDEEKDRQRRRLEVVFPHLKCYEIQGPPPGKTVSLRTQFPLERKVPVGAPQGLCVPVEKTVLYRETPPPPPEVEG